MIEVIKAGKTMQGRAVLESLSFALQPERFYGIIGPNGAGKSTLLQLLSGISKPSSGQVLLDGKEVSALPPKRLAKRLAVLQQGGLPAVGFTVRQTVAMGRFPFQNWFGDESGDAEPLIDEAIRVMGLGKLENRSLAALSGGERQRVALAKVMAQEPEIVLLDEPTTYLDIGYQIQLLDTVRQWRREKGITVIAVLHDLNLAALYCDELLVLHEGRLISQGAPEEVLDEELIRHVYGAGAEIVAHPANGMPQILLRPGVR
ncbi:ABC transporter ATP-binding protein [Paenibacillus sp. NPDC058071]|uniref:ABC transporter ATP-binding protein n=1 Tax=Paenibacillus sp. NPDC058071 TaxID=3346326 RepID=UPI0036DE9A40